MRAMVVLALLGTACAREQAQLCQDQCERGAWQDYADEASCEHVCQTDCAQGDTWGVTDPGLPCAGVSEECVQACDILDECGARTATCLASCEAEGWSQCVLDAEDCIAATRCELD